MERERERGREREGEGEREREREREKGWGEEKFYCWGGRWEFERSFSEGGGGIRAER